jgi:acyl-[acyl-carrier-protein] desaturase
MLKNTVTMPARLMSDGGTADLYAQFAVVAQRIGVYTIRDYADIIEYLVGFWGIADLPGLTDEAARAQDYLGGLAKRYRGLADRPERNPSERPKLPFRWIFNRSV